MLGSYADLVLRPHHIARMVFEGLRVRIPRLGHGQYGGSSSNGKITIGEVIANDSALKSVVPIAKRLCDLICTRFL